MTALVRNNAWNSGGDFSNQDLLWYAKGVGKMMQRGLDDPASWWFFAAIHGEYVNPANPWYPNPPAFPAWGDISSPPAVPATALPNQATQAKYWNQCQHGSWYFLPWHRGYLMALEAQLRADILSLGGPSTWALPYWDYFGGAKGVQAVMPPAVGQKTLPDGTANPLYVAMRYGPDGNGEIYIPTEDWAETHPADPKWSYGDVSSACMSNDSYTGTDPSTPPPGFGGPDTGFSHNGNTHGNMESNPHDLVHVYTGGVISNSNYGLMADPGTAALDPIFYLHHANIDRMWAVWNAAGNANPSDSDWLKGPAKAFVMPMPGNESWTYTPNDVKTLTALNYIYQELTDLTPPALVRLTQRLQSLGVAYAAAAAAQPRAKRAAELLGASEGPVRVAGSGAPPVPVRLDAGNRKQLAASLSASSASPLPDNVYLKLENVTGKLDSTVLGVYINLPAGAGQAERSAQHVGDVGLFGLRRASVKDGAHGGTGLSFILDVSAFVDQLHLQDRLTDEAIQVSLIPRQALPGETAIEVGRVSLYRQSY